MKTLADEILSLLSDEPLSAKHIAKALAADPANVRDAIKQLDEEGRARWFIEGAGGAYNVAPVSAEGIYICCVCHTRWHPPKWMKPHQARKKLTCSRSCANTYRWSLPGYRERVSAAIRAERKTDKAKARLAAHNKRRWSKPEEHEKLSEQNRQRWADPYQNAKQSVAIAKNHRKPEYRAKMAEIRRKEWADPTKREMRVKAIKAGRNTPEFKVKFGEHMKDRWKDPELRAKYMAANKARNAAKSAAAAKRWNEWLSSDEAIWIAEALDNGQTINQIAATLDRSYSYVSYRVKKLQMRDAA